MKLRNYTLKYLAIALLSIIVLWGVLFYIHIREEIGESLDKNLSTYKLDFIQAAQRDSTALSKDERSGTMYHLEEIPEEEALQVKDTYHDAIITDDDVIISARRLTTAFELNGRYYKLDVTTSTLEEKALVTNILYGIIALYVALLLSVLFVNNLLLRRVWKPFYHIITQIEKFQLGKNTRLSTTPTSISEFASLNETITSLVTRAEDTFLSQRQFVENASHELQTPVAISLNRLELLLENEQLTPEAATAMSQVIKSLERLSRLNKTLLMLTRIENNQYLDSTPVNFNKLTHTLLNEFEDLATHKNIHIHLQEAQQPLIFQMNEDLAATLLVNLIKNAIVHNVSEGEVHISIQSNQLHIANTGAEQALDDKRVFERFYKNSISNQSTGLGLAIVQAITNQYGLNIHYAYHDKKHVLLITFPVKK